MTSSLGIGAAAYSNSSGGRYPASVRLRRWTELVPEPTIVTGVQDLFAQYAHRIDGRDFDGFAELFTADADYSLAGNAQQGRDAIRTSCAAS